MTLVGIAMGFGLSHFFGGDGEESDGMNGTTITKKTGEPVGSFSQRKKKKPEAGQKQADPWVLTVAQDGSGQFKTIGEALKNVNSGKTIRLTDSKTYRERITLDNPKRHAGITIEAIAGATILNDSSRTRTLQIIGVPDVTIRGIHFHASGEQGVHLVARARCAGVLIEGCRFTALVGKRWNGIQFESCNPRNVAEQPLVIKRCEFNDLKGGITGLGVPLGTFPTRRIVIRDNLFEKIELDGIQLAGAVSNIQVVGNRLLRCGRKGLSLVYFGNRADQVLVSNNTFFQCNSALQIDDSMTPSGNVRICNNLVLNSRGLDFLMLRIPVAGQKGDGGKPGDVAALMKQWRFANNWRETLQPDTDASSTNAWIPPSPEDVRMDRIDKISRDAGKPDFLRPAADSKLATEGAGQTDPALPTYVGAIPPKGIPAWDWTRTWRAPPGKNKVLTVSKDARDGGKYRTITAALKDAKPWDTVRVVDNATYEGQIVLNDAVRHTGLAIEALNGAAIQAGAPAISVFSVPHMRLSGFRILHGNAPQTSTPFIMIRGRTPGAVLEDIELKLPSTSFPVGISLSQITTTANEPPVVVRRCTIVTSNDAVAINGRILLSDEKPSGGILIYSNRLASQTRTLLLQHPHQRVIVAGNIIDKPKQAGIQIADPGAESGSVIIANNTIANGAMLFRAWSNKSTWKLGRGQVALLGNVFSNPATVDIMAGISTEGRLGSSSTKLADEVLRNWKFSGNWRDLSGSHSNLAIAISKKDRRVPEAPFMSADPLHDDYMRPKPKSPLATGGTGGDLPTYAGAVPPKGVKPWDWNITWRSRMMRAKYAKTSGTKP